MKGRDILKGLVTAAAPGTDEQPPTDVAPAPQHAAPSVRAVSRTLNRLSEGAHAAKELRLQIASGDKVVPLSAAHVQASFVQDRIPVGADAKFEELLTSIKYSGQQVPILVRPHPTRADEYQAAYGHRRIRAAIALNRPVYAVVKPLTDEELILAQGQENGARVDLSFIERSLFAKRLDDRGFDREKIALALSVDKPEVSRLLQVATAIPEEVIMAIGPAPKVGRPRWLDLVDQLKVPGSEKKLRAAVGQPNFGKKDSDGRFSFVLTFMTRVEAPPKRLKPAEFRNGKGKTAAHYQALHRGGRLTIVDDDFAEFITKKMPELVAEFDKKAEGTQ